MCASKMRQCRDKVKTMRERTRRWIDPRRIDGGQPKGDKLVYLRVNEEIKEGVTSSRAFFGIRAT